MLLLFSPSELKHCEISLRWNANGHCFISGTIMTKGVALIYCRLVTLVLNWSNMLQTSSAERLHLSSAKKPLHNWDSGSSLHDLKPLPSFTLTSCQIHTDEWTDTLNCTLQDEAFLPHVLIVAEIDTRYCLLFRNPLFIVVFILSCLSLSVLLSAGN